MTILTDKIIQYIPKTATTSLRGHLLKELTSEIRMHLGHTPLKYLKNLGKGKYNKLPVYAMVREPVSWHTSWYNYTQPRPINCAITEILHRHSHGINEFIRNALDLTNFFSNKNYLKEFKDFAVTQHGGHLSRFFEDFQEVDADYFQNQSLYAFYLFSMINNKTNLYRYPDQLPDFLKDIGLSTKMQKRNTTAYSRQANQQTIDLIKNKDKKILDLFNSLK